MIAVTQASIAPPGPFVPGGRSRTTAVWLFVVAVLVFMMVVVGGATRLTGSGLSITEWKPITGALPPLNATDWAETFRKYRGSAQFHLINQGISLSEFKFLFWWEWAHRLLARWVGVVFALPFLVLLALRRVPRRLIGPCFILLGLGGLQGLVGWWMVKSGLEGRASVAPERLAVHLGLALLLLSALVWTGLDAWSGERRQDGSAQRGWRWPTAIFAGGVFLQCLMGALVAGDGAGRVDNDWPLMDGHVFPIDYWQGAVGATFVHGRAAVQFNHRLLAYGLIVFGVGLAAIAARNRTTPKAVLFLSQLVVVLIIAQAGLGVATLLTGDPLALALAHQANAAILLSVSIFLAWRCRGL
jgi:cytochrome c oxidase assembly protein subunit 15